MRVSSAADILDDKGQERSAKSISPVQTEGTCRARTALSLAKLTRLLTPCASAADEAAFGTREDKLNGCLLQRRAWDTNTELLTALFVAVREPLPQERRLRGEVGMAYTKQQRATVRRRDQMGTVSEEMDAKRALEESATGPIGKASREVWMGSV